MDNNSKNKGLSNADIVKNRKQASKTKDGLFKLFGNKSGIVSFNSYNCFECIYHAKGSEQCKHCRNGENFTRNEMS